MTEARTDRQSWADDCQLRAQGRWGGACSVETGDEVLPACVATLRRQGGKLERLIDTIHLSPPENYLSIYQSGCNFACRKCHSWQFSQRTTGKWRTVAGSYRWIGGRGHFR